jgi:hypothetical protein
MAVCSYCEQEMNGADGCKCMPVKTIDGYLEQVPFGAEKHRTMKPNQRCGDCDALPGHFHHPECDIEECPRCEGQLLSCGCLIA